MGGNLLDFNPVFLCVGNSGIVGDCFGPLVGEFLTKKYGIKQVFGNLCHNITSKNLEVECDKIKTLFPDSKIVVVDAALSQPENVGMVKFLTTGCIPACGTNFKIVGDFSLLGLTCSSGISAMGFLKTVKFNMVLEMANFVAKTISQSLDLITKAKC